MSFEAVAPSTDVLNGYNDAGEAAAKAKGQEEAQAKATAKAQKANAKKEATAKAKEVKSSSSSSSLTTVPDYSDITAPSTAVTHSIVYTEPIIKHEIEPLTMIIFPMLIFLILLGLAVKGISHDIKKNPPYGGFSHKHKKHHPGVMKPRVFK